MNIKAAYKYFTIYKIYQLKAKDFHETIFSDRFTITRYDTLIIRSISQKAPFEKTFVNTIRNHDFIMNVLRNFIIK